MTILLRLGVCRHLIGNPTQQQQEAFMYGLVNKAIEDMVCDRFGGDTWETIKEQAEVDIDTFLCLEAYPDDLTHRLVHAASLVLGLSPSEILQAFGEYWVLYTAQKGYGQLMDMAGNAFLEFIQNLNNLHARAGLNFPHLKPPSFHCTHIQENSLCLHYDSTREGFTPMVEGMVKGLGHRFQTEVEITLRSDRKEGADHDEFSINFKPSQK